MVSTKDVALVGGLALLAGIIVFGGRELFKALPSIGGGIFDVGKSAGEFVFNIGQSTGDVIGGFGQDVFEAGQGAGQAVFDAGKAFGDFVGSTQQQIDQQLKNFFDSQQADFDLFVQQSGQNIEDISESAQKAAEEGGPLSGLFDFFSGLGGQAEPPEELPFQGPFQPIPDFEDLPPFQQLPLTGLGEVQPEPLPPQIGFETESPLLGGGPSFIGGTTTFGDNIVDTLSEVLAIFPELTASQARDALEEFSGLTGNEFAQINPDIINIVGAGNINFGEA